MNTIKTSQKPVLLHLTSKLQNHLFNARKSSSSKDRSASSDEFKSAVRAEMARMAEYGIARK